MTAEHRCGAGRNCRTATVEDGHRVPAQIAEQQGLCDDCAGAVEFAIDDLADTWLLLNGSIGDQSRRGGQRVKGSRSAPINVNTDVDALKASIVEWMVAAAAPISESLGVQDPRPVNNSDSEQYRVVVACSRILSAKVDDVITAPAHDVMIWQGPADTEHPGEFYRDEHGITHGRTIATMTGVEIALKLVDLRRSARSLLALTSPHDKMSLPCPHCNAYELVRSHRAIRLVSGKSKEIDQIDCGNCKLQWPYERYQQLCLIWVKEDEMEREKLQRQLDSERARREFAEWMLAKRDWQFGLALDCTDVSASAFAATVLSADLPDPDEFMSDKDIANLVGVSASTIRVWAHREAGKEAPAITRHVDDDGATVFLVREVWDYAMANANGRAATTRRLSNTKKAVTRESA